MKKRFLQFAVLFALVGFILTNCNNSPQNQITEENIETDDDTEYVEDDLDEGMESDSTNVENVELEQEEE